MEAVPDELKQRRAEVLKRQTERLVLGISRMTTHNGPGIRTLIYFKGCPLRCLWCSTPESQKETREIGIFPKNCIQCGKCVSVCPLHAVNPKDDIVEIDRSLCDCCGKCVEVCYAEAIRFLGKTMTIRELVNEARKDKVFYKHSGGGVTVSGGESLMHIDFTQKLMEALKEEGINIGIDTCGYVSWIDIEKILPYTDFFLWDIKHMNPETHKKLTGVSNEPILKNLRAVSEKNIPIYIRLPMITGYNDSEVNIRNVCKFAQGLSSLAEINLLPLHHLGSARYQSLNLAYPMADLPLQSNAFMQDMKRIVESYGLKCSIIG